MVLIFPRSLKECVIYSTRQRIEQSHLNKMFEYGQEERGFIRRLWANLSATVGFPSKRKQHTHTHTHKKRPDWIELIFCILCFVFVALLEEVGKDKYSGGGEKRKSRPIVDSIDRE